MSQSIRRGLMPTLADVPDPAEASDPIGVLPLILGGDVRIEAPIERDVFADPGLVMAMTGVWVALSWLSSLLLPPLVAAGLGVAGVGACAAYALYHLVYVPWRDGPRPLRRAIRAAERAIHPRVAHVEAPIEPMLPARGLALPLAPAPARRPFDPLDPEDRARAAVLFTCRVADGLALDGGLHITLLQLRRQPARDRARRIADWVEIWRWMSRLDDPRAAWLGAMALAEDRRWTRALAALDGLRAHGEPPWTADLHRAIAEAGPTAARAAAAVHRADPAALDALLDAKSDHDPAARATLVQARLRLDDPPIERWLHAAEWGAALITVEAQRLSAAHWQRLTAHPAPGVALIAAERALSRGSGALAAARAALDRDDVRAAMGDDPPAAWLAAIELLIIRVGLDGDRRDRARIDRWSDVPGLEATAATAREAL